MGAADAIHAAAKVSYQKLDRLRREKTALLKIVNANEIKDPTQNITHC